mgnify:CR=1 FL=1
MANLVSVAEIMPSVPGSSSPGGSRADSVAAQISRFALWQESWCSGVVCHMPVNPYFSANVPNHLWRRLASASHKAVEGREWLSLIGGPCPSGALSCSAFALLRLKSIWMHFPSRKSANSCVFRVSIIVMVCWRSVSW